MESGLVFVTVFFSIIGILLLIYIIYRVNKKNIHRNGDVNQNKETCGRKKVERFVLDME